MAEKSIKIPLTPCVTKDDGNPRRNSTGIVRKASAGPRKPSSPYYLRASTGSCHDFCKYGRKHSFAVKARKPMSKRVIPPSGKQKNIKSEVIAEKRKIAAVKQKPSTDFKIHSPEQKMKHVVPVGRENMAVKLKPFPNTMHSPEPLEVIKREILVPKKNPSNTKIVKDKEMKMTIYSNRYPAPKSKPVMMRPSKTSTASVGSNGSKKTAMETGKVCGTSKKAVKKLLAPPTVSFSLKPSGSSVVSLYSPKFSSLKLVSPMKYQCRTQNAESGKPSNDKVWKAESKKPACDKIQERSLHVVETETNERILECIQVDGIVQVSPSSYPLLQSPKLLSHADSQFLSSHADDVNSESTDREVLKQSVFADEEDSQDSDYSDREGLEELEYTESKSDEFISENDVILNIKAVDTSKGNGNQIPRKYRVISSDDKDNALTNCIVNIDEVDTLKGNQNQCLRKGRIISAEDEENELTKSKFRRGKIVDIQSESNVPRKLKFRRGRVVDSNDIRNYFRRRTFKKIEAGDDKNGAKSSSEKVILRHQDMQGKKDAQGLFNNVIEETASKLVESRKGKVKALVGAFETVISLQESKPSARTGT